MSLSGERRLQEENEDEYAGHVASRSNTETKSLGGSTTNRSQKTHCSWAAPIHLHPDEFSNVSSPSRLGTQRTRKRKGTPNAKTSTDDSSLPPELPPVQDSSFKGWLTSSILDTLNVAAGVTLATTGQLIAPPLLMTKTFLLPALLALFVDTMDSITPPRVKDWLRIISSSVHHLCSVLTSTEKGQTFSNQSVIVLQDILQALSSPETRQVLVDGMACNVKLADALHTPEMQAWLEQLSILGCRLVDAAASGKSKQLIQDTKDLIWKGIETATDPATTLALAEVTAQLCDALEDAQHSLNPTPRAQRNAQNQATYLNPLQMSDYPQQASMEEIILSCLGLEEEERGEEEDATSIPPIPSNVTWNEEQPTTESNDQEWKERGDMVDTDLLRDRIFRGQRPQPRRNPTSSAISSAKSSIESSGPPAEHLPMIPSQDDEEIDETENLIAKDKATNGTSGNANIIQEESAKPIQKDEDMEDIVRDRLPTENKRSKANYLLPSFNRNQGNDVPAALQFYRILDDMLTRNRSERFDRQVCEEATINNPSEAIPKGSTQDSFKLLKAKVKKLREDGTQRLLRARTSHQRKRFATFQQLSKQRQGIILLGAVIMACIVLIWIGFAIYGMYKFVNSKPTPTLVNAQSSPIPSSTNSEVVIRIIREIVHVREDGSIIETSPDSVVSEEDIEKVTECVAYAFQ